MPFPYTFPFWFDIAIRYTSVQRVRYQTGLLEPDDMDEVTLKTVIEEAESMIDSWARKDGVNTDPWLITVPTQITHIATMKSAQMALARKVLDARIAASGSLGGTTATMPSTEGPRYLADQAAKGWAEFLVMIGKTAPAAQKFRLKADVSTFSEKAWRKKKKTSS
jgi:hypothetical protein